LFILYGGGSNGKSTFIRTIETLVGQYATATSTETLLVKKGGGAIPNDIANLHGARFVSAVEAEAQRTLAESLIKRLTGGDTMSARYLYKEYFSFVPTSKIWLATNHKPTIRGTDRAIWRRIRLIPFDVTIPTIEQDKDLGSKLERELPGILQWAVKGCLAWQQQGLNPPSVVDKATHAYQKEMDVLSQFLNDCCRPRAGAVVTKNDLYNEYVQWCQENGEPFLSKRELNTRLVEKDIKSARSATARLWLGIELVSQVEERHTR
jgi:putative DNA primase/helicase